MIYNQIINNATENEMTSYIINAAGTELIAEIQTTLPSGTEVRYSRLKTEECIDAAREFNLVNAKHGKISSAAKWGGEAMQHKHIESNGGEVMTGSEINPREFFIA